MATITEANIFETGMLIVLRAGQYAGRRKLDEEQMKGLPTEIVRGVQDMFDAKFKELLAESSAIVMRARGFIANVSIPFPIGNVYFIRNTNIQMVIDFMDERIKERQELVENIVDNYLDAIKRFKAKYPEYYKASKGKYPSLDELKDKFYMTYQFFQITAPDKNNKLISPEQYKAENMKFKNAIVQMKEEVLATIYETLLNTTAKLKAQCDDSKINQTTIDSINRFLLKIDTAYADFIDRKDMKKAIAAIRKEMTGISADSLRSSDSIKEDFVKELQTTINDLKVLPDIPLKRAIQI